jgi:hypothetical protein
MSYKNVGNQKGFAHLVILVGVVVVVAVAGAGLSVKRHKDHENALQLQRQNASQKIAKEYFQSCHRTNHGEWHAHDSYAGSHQFNPNADTYT